MEGKYLIKLDVDETEKNVLLKRLSYLAEDAQQQVVAYDLKAKIDLAWLESEFHDEADAHNDWVNREMYGKEIQPDPNVVVRHVDGRDVVVLR